MIQKFLILILTPHLLLAATDSTTLNKARAEYQKKKYDKAIQIYSSIPQSSDYWTLAIEERAHTYGRKGEYNRALADLTTLFSPVFIHSLGPEPYFTAAITHLRLCQYGKIYEVFDKFKTHIRPRATAMTNMIEGRANDLILQAIEKLKLGGMSVNSYAVLAPQLPNLFHEDAKIKASLNNPTKLIARMKELAREDLTEIERVSTKMKLVEAEVIQRLHIVEKSKDEDRNKMGSFKSNKDQMVFPYNGEVWIDELDSYQVQAQQCPQPKEGS